MSLELKIPMETKNTYMYMCTNFQEHSHLETEDTHTQVITNSLFFLFFCVFFTSAPTVPSKAQPPKLHKNGLQTPIEDNVILHEMHSFFVQVLIHAYSISSQLFIRFDALLDAF